MKIWFEHLTEQLIFVDDEQSARDVLVRMTRDAGFNWFAYARVQDNTLAVLSNYHQSWQDRYFEQAYFAIDPVMIGIRNRGCVFSWSNEAAPHPVGRSPETRAREMFFEDASAFGIRSGLSVPVTVGFGNTAVLTLASDDRAFAAGLVVDPIAAAAAVGQIHMRLDAIASGARPHRPVQMTARELRCLRWSAEGKSMRTIAALENTTYANVCYFLRNAKQALNAQTLAQATKIATQLRLL